MASAIWWILRVRGNFKSKTDLTGKISFGLWCLKHVLTFGGNWSPDFFISNEEWTCSIPSKSSSLVFPIMRMLLTNFCIFRTPAIAASVLWQKMSPELTIPIGALQYRYRPHFVMKHSYLLDSSSSSNCQYPDLASNVAKYLASDSI